MPSNPLALKQELQELREAYDGAPFGMCSLDLSRKITRINAVALEWLGVDREQLHSVEDLLPFLSDKSRKDYDVATFLFDKSRRVEGLDLELVPPNRPARVIRMTALSSYDEAGGLKGIRASFFDITEIRKLQETLQELNQEQAAMLNSDLVGILKVQDHKVIWQNDTFTTLLGYSPLELFNSIPKYLFFDPATYDHILGEGYPTIAKHGTYRIQARLRRKDGMALWADLSATRLMDSSAYLWVCLDITLQKEHQQQVEHIAFHDALTGLPNRLLMSDRLSQACRQADRSGAFVGVCYLDLDGFKPVNDTHGHGAGDKVLKQLANRLQQATRSVDTIARLGGDEFILIAPVERPDRLNPLLSRVLGAIAEPIPISPDLQVTVTGSIGVALYPIHGAREPELLGTADKALYAAKSAGKNQVYFAAPPEGPLTRSK